MLWPFDENIPTNAYNIDKTKKNPPVFKATGPSLAKENPDYSCLKILVKTFQNGEKNNIFLAQVGTKKKLLQKKLYPHPTLFFFRPLS